MTIHHDLDSADRHELASLPAKGLEWLAGEHKVDRVGMTFGKRAFDIVFALILLVPLSFVIVLVMVTLLVTQGRPLFYVAPRMRAPGEQFDLLKFRTMLREDDDSGATGAHKHWRITRVGRILRRTRIDELPQLFNILRGDMSFVGPRPHRTVQIHGWLKEIPQWAVRHQVRPGLSGLAQVVGSYYYTPLQKLRYDRVYIRHISLALDVKLLLLAFLVVFWLRWQPDWDGHIPRRWLRWGS